MKTKSARNRLSKRQQLYRHMRRTMRRGPRGDKDQSKVPTAFRRYARQYAKGGSSIG